MRRSLFGLWVAVFCLAPRPAAAEVIWRGDFETGTTEQWRGASKFDTVKVVTEPVREGKHALRIDWTKAARKGDRDRIELQHQPAPPGTSEGTERFFGWSVFLPRKLTDDSHSLGYFESRNSWRQLMAFEVKGEDILYTTRVPYAPQWNGKGKMTAGRWHDFAVHVLWSRDSEKGFVEVWFDGEKVVPRTKTATLLDDNPAFFQIGLMRATSDVPETIVIDHVVEATTLAEVTPPKLAEPKVSAGVNDPADNPSEKFLAEHCFACHSGEKPEGKLDLKGLALDFGEKAKRDRWQKVVEQLKSGAMPPKDNPRPPAKEIKGLIAWIDRRVAAAEAAHRGDQGRVVLRRLNRAEYRNTVRDLLHVDVDLNDLLPVDDSAGGFDNSAEALHVSSYLMDNYLAAADRVLDAAIASGPRPWQIDKRFDLKEEKSLKPTGSVYRHVDDGVAIFSSWVSANIQVTMWNFRTFFRGKYRIRISGYGFQSESKPVTFHVMAGTMAEPTQQYLVDYFAVPADKPTVIEFEEILEPKNTIRIVADGLPAKPPDVEKVGSDKYGGPGLVVQWVEIEGPLLDSWPPKSHRQIFGEMKQTQVAENPKRFEVASAQPLADAERILREFARRAFRRPVTDADIKPFLARVKTQLDRGTSFEQAMRVGLKGVLVSPHFLFLRERTADGTRLDDFALASRLSYFLWSSMPDEELLKLAEGGRTLQSEANGSQPAGLSDPDVRRRQVERMLNDPKAEQFTTNFVGQWLSLRNIDATTPDPMLYPEFDDILKTAMVKEAVLFFDEVLKNDLSLTNFVASDFTMLNGRLAKHYGILDVEGLEFRKLSLPAESHRGGVLTMAAVMKVTANGTTTSPVLRGAWVLDRILGTPPPKPTVDIEAVEPDIRGATTIRAQLGKHRENAACANCHAVIDPHGFALENFDVIGGWRDNYRKVGDFDRAMVNGRLVRYRNGPEVQAGDVLADGRRFKNIDEYKQLLLADKDQLARALTEKLLAYATGAVPTAADRPQIEAIVSKVRERKYGLRSLVHEVVLSEVFQRK
jgi:hypothetical protein